MTTERRDSDFFSLCGHFRGKKFEERKASELYSSLWTRDDANDDDANDDRMIADPPDVVDLLSTSQPGSPTSSSRPRRRSAITKKIGRADTGIAHRVVERVLSGVNLSRGRRGTIRGTVNARGGAELFRPSVNRPRRQHRVAIGRHRYSSDNALKQIKPENTREVFQVLFKEAVSGFIMGGFFRDDSVFLIARVGRHISVDWFSRRDIAAIGERVGERFRRRSAVVRREVGF